MTPQIITLIKLACCFLALFAGAELLYHFGKIKTEYTRKLVHVGTGILTLMFPYYFNSLWPVTILCTAFLGILVFSRVWNFLPSINNIGRRSAGSISYPIIVVIVFAFYVYHQQDDSVFNSLLYFYLPIMAMAIGDPVAAIAGGGMNNVGGKKTNKGTVAFFVVVSVVSWLLMYVLNNGSWGPLTILLLAISVAALTALVERITKGGWDNLTIPLAASAYLFLITKWVA